LGKVNDVFAKFSFLNK